MKTLTGFSPLSLLACMVLGFAGLAGTAKADLLVYELSFRTISNEVNYPSLYGGYFVVDENAGTFSSIVVLGDPVSGAPYYTTSLLSGTYFELLSEGGELFGVMSGGTGSGGEIAESVSFQSIGKLSRNVRVSGTSTMRVARNPRGVLLLNSPEVYTTSNSSGNGTSGDRVLEFGFAGSSEVRARFDEGFTRFVNNERMTSADALQEAIRRVENRGILPQPSPSPGPNPSPTPTPVPTPTPTPSPTP